ncbi:MAG: ABC transporter ATP-binding protein [Chitinophagaceae bacterium]|nr:ABC transporter ATP-binding protein [Chitinophagaceae bacterium]
MKITLTDAGKRFNRDWIFRHLHYEFIAGRSYAITGANGSGKSTLLQAIAGAIGISEGKIAYAGDGRTIEPDKVYQYLSIAAPYLDVIEEMTAGEFLKFHASFKPFFPSWTVKEILAEVGLQTAADKQIRFYSSGMRQRVRLAQAVFSNTPLVLLDEPCTNLDMDGISLYRRLIAGHCKDRLVIVSSNDRQEYEFCEEIINIMEYKPTNGQK